MKKKIGFLYFEEIHHIPHFIGIATELSKLEDQNHTIDILTFINNHEYLYKLINLLKPENINVIQLKQPISRFLIDKITGRSKPSSVYLYKKHKDLLLSYDALVFTEKNHKYLYKYRKKKLYPKFISVNHGAAGREHSFQQSIKLFDYNLLHGQFQLTSLKSKNLLINGYEVVGYSKFDIVAKENKRHFFFNNKKPIVLYNPHFNKISSSWYRHGNDILEYFYNSNEYNLIFSPHIYLFNRKGFLKRSAIDEKYFNKDNIHIDLGSIKSSDMTYSLNSDIYLGDISSQVYEFQTIPRPCIFINSNQIDWKDNINYRFWKTGSVINSIKKLDETLKKLDVNKKTYLKKQKKILSENFYKDEKYSASQKAAIAIHEYLNSL